MVHYHLAHVPVHLALVLAHQLVERKLATGGVLKLEEYFVVFQTRKKAHLGGGGGGWTAKYSPRLIPATKKTSTCLELANLPIFRGNLRGHNRPATPKNNSVKLIRNLSRP